MRHRLGLRKLGRDTQHRMALLRNLAEALLRHEHIVTTVPKAKELRPFVERLITVAKRGVKAGDPKGRTLAARRLVMRDVVNEDVVAKLFDHLAPRFMERPGGYTRIMRLGHRRGDGGEIAQIELIGSEFDPKKAEAEKAAKEAAGDEPKQQKSLGERLRSAGQNLRSTGKKEAKGDAPRAKVGKPAKGAAKKTTTPRKAGGS
ncbi:MAG TPA: 50S ribosomal protein L17 [Vicinamibacterales bacterium]|nr:50S ribosomal protein L17 [Vicinamibacterales bacterium]